MDESSYTQIMRDFVNGELNSLITVAKPHLSCEFALGQDIPLTEMDKYKMHDLGGVRPYHENEPYVLVRCKNGYRYEINVDGDSLIAIAEDVIKLVACK